MLAAWLALSCTGPTSGSACAEGARFADADGDGFGDPSRSLGPCDPGVADDTDCDDGDPAVYPGAPAACDGAVDQDCDGVPEPDDEDLDGDGTGTCAGDCDDGDPAIVQCVASCPDPDGFALASFFTDTANPCVLDPTVSLCSTDPERPDTHADGARLHRFAWRDDGAELRPELLVFVPPGEGEHNFETLKWGAYAGYRVLSLGWYSDPFVQACAHDDTCFTEVRRELTYGDDTSPYLTIAPNDALVGRLAAALAYLSTEFPDMGFDEYWSEADGVRWDRIVLWGWSEGAGEAAYISRYEPLDGLVLISGPKELVGPPLEPATWVTLPPAVLPCAQFGFYHRLEEHAEYTDGSLEALGLALPSVDVDTTPWPYGDAQVLHTEVAEFDASWCSYHQAMAMDECISDELLEPYLYLFCRAGEVESCP